MKIVLAIVMIVVGLLILSLVISLLSGCAYDDYHNRDGTPKSPLMSDKDDPPTPVEMPKPKGQ